MTSYFNACDVTVANSNRKNFLQLFWRALCAPLFEKGSAIHAYLHCRASFTTFGLITSGSGTLSNVYHSSILIISMDVGDTWDMPHAHLNEEDVSEISSTQRSSPIICRVSWYSCRTFSQKGRSAIDWARWRHKTNAHRGPAPKSCVGPRTC